MGNFARSQAERARVRQARQFELANDISIIISKLFYEGCDAAMTSARQIASGRVAHKIDKTGTQYVPDLVAVETCAKRLLEDAREYIEDAKRQWNQPGVSSRIVVTRDVARDIKLTLQLAFLVKQGRRDKAIQCIDANQLNQRVVDFTCDLIDGDPLEVLTARREDTYVDQ